MTLRAMLVRVLVLATVLGACSVPEEREARVQDDDAVPFGLLAPDTPPLLPPAGSTATESASVCFIRDGALAVVDVALEPPVELSELVEALGEPPDPSGGSLRSAVGEPALVHDVQLVAGVARVDLLPAVSTLAADDQLLAIAQLVCTLTARPGVGPVSFTLEGSQLDVPRADGSLTSGPVSRDDYTELLG